MGKLFLQIITGAVGLLTMVLGLIQLAFGVHSPMYA